MLPFLFNRAFEDATNTRLNSQGWPRVVRQELDEFAHSARAIVVGPLGGHA